MRKTLIALAISGVIAAPALAEEPTFTAALLGGQQLNFDSAYDNDFSLGLQLGVDLAKGWSVQAELTTSSPEIGYPATTGTPIDSDLMTGSLNLLHFFEGERKLVPFVGFGLSFSDADVDDTTQLRAPRDTSGFGPNLAAGFRYNVRENSFFLAEARLNSLTRENYSNLQVLVGFGLGFGGSGIHNSRGETAESARLTVAEEARMAAEEKARMAAEEKARLEAEELARQKAEDEARKKAEEEARRKAEEEARRAAEEKARMEAEAAVAAAAAEVEALQAELGDEVVVSRVDDDTLKVTFSNVLFDFNSSRVNADYSEMLSRLAAYMQANGGLSARVEGHTDAKGSEEYNQTLSEKRAEAVAAFLVGKGVDAGRLASTGFGEARPVAPNTHEDGSDNPEGRAMNRRCELFLDKN